MAGIDKIFEKSELSESQKKSKMIFGRLLISLRKQGAIKLYSLLGGVEQTDIRDGKIILSFKDKATYDMVNNQHDIDGINTILKTLDESLSLEIKSLEKTHLDEFKFVEFLKEEFGKILTIK